MHFSIRTNKAMLQNRLAMLAAALLKEGRTIFNLSDSNPTLHGLLPKGADKIFSGLKAGFYNPDPKGLYSARTALAKAYGHSPDDYFFCASTSEAYSWLFKLLCDPGDSILVPRPGYPLFDNLASIESVLALPYSLEYWHPEGWAVDMDDLCSKAKQKGVKAIVVINPNNPTGSYINKNEKTKILELCAKYGIALIADEVFFPFALEKEGAKFRMDGGEHCLCFSLDGLSKQLGLPQAKLGWLRVSGPGKKEAMERLELIADTFLSVSALPMLALPGLLTLKEAYISNLTERTQHNLKTARLVFETAGSPYRILRCDGGWTALLEFPKYKSEEETVLSLLKEEFISVQPGYFFDMERDGFLALSLILKPDEFLYGIYRLKKQIDSFGQCFDP